MTAPMPWKMNMIRRLSEPTAPRVFSHADLVSWMQEMGVVEKHRRTLFRALKEWEHAGLIQRVVSGLYLNGQAHPLPTLEEAAGLLRPGAIVSLSTVLGRAGVLNNPTHWVTATVPSTQALTGRDVEADNGTLFKFARMDPSLLPVKGESWAQDALQPYTAVPTATPEKALLDWLYLSTSPHGATRWPLPPVYDWDLSDLDSDKLTRLATRMGLMEVLSQFQAALEQEAPRVALRRPRIS